MSGGNDQVMLEGSIRRAVDVAVLQPEIWPTTRLRFVAAFNPSKSETAHLPPETEIAFLPMEAIGEDGSANTEGRRELAAVQQGYTYFRDGDVVIAKITPCFENGKGAVMRGLLGGFGFGTTELIVARPMPSQATSEFLHWLFVSPLFRDAATAFMYGAGGQKRVPDDFVRDFVVALPSLAEQSAIATFLDRETGKIDALVAEQERLMALLKEKRQAVISQAVTKGLNPNAKMKPSGVNFLRHGNWQTMRLRFIAAFNPSKSETAHLSSETEVTFLPMEAIGEDGSVNTEGRRELAAVQQGYTYFRDGDVVIAKITPCFENGKGAVMRGLLGGIGFGTTELIVARPIPSRTLSAFLHWLFVSPLFRDAATAYMYGAGGQKRVPDDFVRDFVVALPSLAEQSAIAAFLDQEIGKLERLTEEATRAIALLKERRAALISAAVTGKIDVRDLAPAEAVA